MKKTFTAFFIILSTLLTLFNYQAFAFDESNCLMCHKHRGLSYIDKEGKFRLLYVTESIYQNSPHGLFSCLDCHVDIEEVPHSNAEKVNCFTKCHLEDSIEPFSHAEVEVNMAGNVHSPVDENGIQKPYPEDYPTCKTCHKDPLYRPLSFFKKLRPGVSEKIMSRCLVCHDDPLFVSKFYSHFTSRMQKGRSSLDIINLCAKCHEDAGFLKRHNQPHVVHSYGESYHGKAVFLGDEMAPDCIDCHVEYNSSIHAIYSHDDPRSSVHPDNRFDTCSNIDCHPDASRNLMDFKVHMMADKERQPAEYYVSLFFVILTISSFLPIMIAAIMDSIRRLISGKPKLEKKSRQPRPFVDGVELGSTEPIIKEIKGNRFFQHLTLNQRWQHVLLMISFTGLAVTGIPMKYYYVDWMNRFYQLMGGIDLATLLHRVFAVMMTVIFLYHFAYIAATYIYFYLLPLKRAGKINAKNIFMSIYVMPMVPNLDDLLNIWGSMRYRLFLSEVKPAASRFNMKEKFGYLAVFWGVPIIGLSGMILWGEEVFTKIFPGNLLNFCLIAHSDEALLACVVIFCWHIYNTHLKLEFFPMGLSWFTGSKKEHELPDEHYGYYLGALEKQGYTPQEHTGNPGFIAAIKEKLSEGIILAGLIAVTVYLTWLIFYTVFGFHVRTIGRIPEKMHLTEPRFLEEKILGGKGEEEEENRFYRGFRIVKEQEVTDHYHNIELEVGPDQRSQCIQCHGDFPHGKTDQLRSYLNMHAFYLSCETCHIRPETADVPFEYKWYDRETGKILSKNPNLGLKEIDAFGIKLVPGETVNGKWQRFDNDDVIDFAQSFRERVENGIVPIEKKKDAINKIHEQLSEKSITCQQCHKKEETLIPYRKIGYTPERIQSLYSRDIVKMIDQYDIFIIPTFLKNPK